MKQNSPMHILSNSTSESFIIINATCVTKYKISGNEKWPFLNTRAHMGQQVVKTLYHSPVFGVRMCFTSEVCTTCAVWKLLNEELQHLLSHRPITYLKAWKLQLLSSLILFSLPRCVSFVTHKSHLTVTWRNAWRWFKAIIPPLLKTV